MNIIDDCLLEDLQGVPEATDDLLGRYCLRRTLRSNDAFISLSYYECRF